MRELKILAVVLAVAGMCSLASAQVFSEDFESYASGTALHGKGGWKGWDNTAGAGAPTSSKYAYSGKNSVEIVGTADLVHEFKLAGGKYEFSAMQYIPKGTTGESFFILLNQYADGGAANDWSIQLKFNLATGVITAEAEGDNATAEIVYDRWVELKFRIDLTKDTCEWYYAGALIKTHEWDDNDHGTLQAIDLYGNNASSIYYDDIKITQYYDYKAKLVSPADGAAGIELPLLQWSKGDKAYFHNVYFGTTPELTEANLVKSMTTELLYYHFPGVESGATYYWRIDEVEADGTTVHTGDVWSFTSATPQAFSPQPRNGDKWIATTIELVWNPGRGAAEHVLYFGTDKAAVVARAAGVSKGSLFSPNYLPDELAKNTVYYWAVDEIDSAGVTHMGELWTFLTVGGPGGVKAEYFSGMTPGDEPAITRTETNIDFNWGEGSGPGTPVPNDGFSARWTADLEIAVADTYTFFTRSDDGSRLWLDNKLIVDKWVDQSATDTASAPIYLEPGIYALRMEYYENGGGASAQLYWQTPTMARQVIPAGPLQPPVHAMAYYPMNKATGIRLDAILDWTPGQNATGHDVYFGLDKAAVAAATTSTADIYRGRQRADETSFDPGSLDANTTYYWRIDEIDNANTVIGTVWSFTTAAGLVIDDMDAYTDDEGSRIYETWEDGLTTGDNGSMVGYESAPFAERSIVHSPGQSMPLAFDNTKAPYYSEARRTFDTAQNWTVGGGSVLSLFARGKTTSDAAVVYVYLEDSAGKSAVVSYPDSTLAYAPVWLEWKIPLSSFAGVNAAKIKKMCIGVGDRKNPVAGGAGLIYIDDIRIIKP